MNSDPNEATIRNQSEIGHVGGDTAGDGPQHEARRHGGQIDDGDLLQPQAVGEGDDGVEGEEAGHPGGAPGGGGAGADDQKADPDHAGGADRYDAGGDGPQPLAGVEAVGFDVERVVHEVRAARDQTPGNEGAEDGQDVFRGDREPGRSGGGEHEHVLDPLPGAGGPQQPAGHGVLPPGPLDDRR